MTRFLVVVMTFFSLFLQACSDKTDRDSGDWPVSEATSRPVQAESVYEMNQSASQIEEIRQSQIVGKKNLRIAERSDYLLLGADRYVYLADARLLEEGVRSQWKERQEITVSGFWVPVSHEERKFLLYAQAIPHHPSTEPSPLVGTETDPIFESTYQLRSDMKFLIRSVIR